MTTCECGRVQGWWKDAQAGLAVLHTPDPADRQIAAILSLHNGFLHDGPTLIPTTYTDPLTGQQIAFPPGQNETFWRQLHNEATITPRGPETVRVWDRSSRACWAVILEPGTTADTEWATPATVRPRQSIRSGSRSDTAPAE